MTSSAQISAGIRAALRDRADAWRFLSEFAADWRAPLRAEDGFADADLHEAERRLGVPLPSTLREAYLLFGRRDDLVRNQDRLERPDGLYVREGALVYQTENQGAAEWGVLLDDVGQADPPTFYRASLADPSTERWEPWTQRLSVALLELFMAETALYEADGLSDAGELIGPLPKGFEPLPAILPERFDSVWFADEDVLVHVQSGYWLTVRARSPQVLDALRAALPLEWVCAM